MFAVTLLSALPLRWALALGRFGGWFTFAVLRVRRKVVLDNLAHVFGEEKSEAERLAIAREAYEHMVMMFVEVIRASRGPKDLAEIVSYDPLDFFHELRERGGGVVIMQPHLGNFDLAAYAFAIQGFHLHTVMKKVNNPRINELLVGTRGRFNITVHIKAKDTYAKLLELLQGGGWLGVVPDQRPRGGRGVEVDFLGKPARIYPGPALLSLETGARMVLGWGERQADPTRHHVHVHVFDEYQPTGDRDADVQAMMQTVADAMSDAIRQAPGQYFWFHRLWGKEVSDPTRERRVLRERPTAPSPEPSEVAD